MGTDRHRIEDKTAILWDAAVGRRLRSSDGHKRHRRLRGVQPDGRQIVTSSDYGTAIVWDAAITRQE